MTHAEYEISGLTLQLTTATFRTREINGGGASDRFRIKIWHQATGVIIYDNQMGTSDDAGLGDSTILGGGSIVIHPASKK
ncbi:MAG: hypothetical protein L0Z50_03460 [Verrucomicrobiales bacterium]|nr:hypothetical protein [Verrucomicrobiales bacterium]